LILIFFVLFTLFVSTKAQLGFDCPCSKFPQNFLPDSVPIVIYEGEKRVCWNGKFFELTLFYSDGCSFMATYIQSEIFQLVYLGTNETVEGKFGYAHPVGQYGEPTNYCIGQVGSNYFIYSIDNCQSYTFRDNLLLVTVEKTATKYKFQDLYLSDYYFLDDNKLLDTAIISNINFDVINNTTVSQDEELSIERQITSSSTIEYRNGFSFTAGGGISFLSLSVSTTLSFDVTKSFTNAEQFSINHKASISIPCKTRVQASLNLVRNNVIKTLVMLFKSTSTSNVLNSTLLYQSQEYTIQKTVTEYSIGASDQGNCNTQVSTYRHIFSDLPLNFTNRLYQCSNTLGHC